MTSEGATPKPTQRSGSDTLLHVLAFGGLIRAVIAETSRSIEELRAIHTSSPPVSAAVGRTATGAVLLAASMEKVTAREPVLTVRVNGDGPAGSIIATASPNGWLRAIVSNPHADSESRPDGKLDVAGVVGRSGTFEVARDLGFGEPYQGVVPIVSGEIAEDFSHYLRESEQVMSACSLGVFVHPTEGVTHAGGFIVQLMPGAEEVAGDLEQRILDFGPVTQRLREGVTVDEIARELFPQGSQILERRNVMFRCGCSMERVERALKLLGEDELRSIHEQTMREAVSMTCGFCRTEYPVTSEKVVQLLGELADEV